MSTDPRSTKPETLGPFTLGNIIGSGGFGTVYRATDAAGAVVALKVLAPHADSQETVRRFEREGNIRIDHPNVVSVIDAGQDRGLSYIAFELLEGQPLGTRLEDAPLPVPAVIDIGLQICRGLSAAHERNIVHRDLKPGNVFCCNDGRIKVLDFGIARPMSQAGPELTMAGSVIGTPGYLSPEQAKGDPDIQATADLWALGVILYQAISGKNPFIRSTAVATILAVVLEDAPPLGDKGEALPRGLAEIVHQCLHKDPQKRWRSAEELQTALSGVDLTASRVTGVPEALVPSLPLDEQRVVALLLASEVHDLPALERAVLEWGGAIIPMLGGAIAVFGGRTYEGDETARAVSAALLARDATGFVAVAVGRVTGSGGTVSGDAVDAVERAVAARLAGVAVDVAAARSLGGQFELKPAGDGVFEVPRSLPRRETGSFPTLREDLPLLGREAELAQLDAAIANAFDDQRGTVVWVTGPPGIGKSRLRAELERRLRSRDIPTLAGRGESHRRDAAFHLMASALRSEPTLEPFFLNPGVSVERRRDALEGLLVSVLGDAAWARQCLVPLGRLLGLPDVGDDAHAHQRTDAQLMADRARISLADLLGSMGQRGPLALVLDDVQWADVPSMKLVDELLGRLGDRPVLVFVAARPELGEDQPELFSGREVLRIAPRGLHSRDVATVAAAIAAREVAPALVEEITLRTGGNPFFVEQIMRELVDSDLLDRRLDTLPIPLDVEGAVQSRLDHLPLDEKQLCKRAAVFLGAFTEPGLRALEQPEPARFLGSLARRGLVSARGGRSNAEREYRFRNALVAEVAYRMNSDDARRDLHKHAALHLREVVDADREELGRHWELGGQLAEAANAYADGARRAAKRGDSQSMLRCSERALSLGLTGADAFDLHVARADALSFVGERAAQGVEIERALALATDARMRARALTEKAAMLASVGDHDQGLEVATEAVKVARATTDADALASALARYGWLLLYAGRVSEAGTAIGEAASLGPLTKETAAAVAVWRAQLFTAMGDLGKRKAAYAESIARFRELGDLRRAASAECNLADTFNRVGAYEEAEAALREAVSFCQRVGNRVVEGYALANLGYSLAGQGRLNEANATFAAGLAIAEELGRPRLALAIRLYVARAGAGVSSPPSATARPREAVVNAREIAADAEDHGLPALQASALALASKAALASGDAAGALSDAERAMELRDEIGTMEEDEAEIFLALAEALDANGQRERAREIVARGASRLEFLAGRIEDPTWRARFLVEVPVNRRLIELDGPS